MMIWYAPFDWSIKNDYLYKLPLFVCLFCCFTSQVNSYGHCGTVSSPSHTFSWASLNKQLTSTSCTYFRLYWQQPFLNDSAEGRRMTVESISWSISTKVWDRAGIELATPGSAVRLASVARHVTDCTTRPSKLPYMNPWLNVVAPRVKGCVLTHPERYQHLKFFLQNTSMN